MLVFVCGAALFFISQTHAQHCFALTADDTVLIAGDTATIWLERIDTASIDSIDPQRCEDPSEIYWRLNAATGVQGWSDRSKYRITTTVAGRDIEIIAEVDHAADDFNDTIHVRVVPRSADSLKIELSPPALHAEDDSIFDTVVVLETGQATTVFPVLRDRYGNITGIAPDPDIYSSDSALRVTEGDSGALLMYAEQKDMAARVIAVSGNLADTVTVRVPASWEPHIGFPGPGDSLRAAPVAAVAGLPFTSIVSLRESGTVIRGAWFGAVRLDDLFETSPDTSLPAPMILHTGRDGQVDTLAFGATADILFVNGAAAFDLLLFEAPRERSHRVMASVGDKFDTTAAITLDLDPVDINMVDSIAGAAPDTLYAGQTLRLYAIGEDAYGNTRHERANWTFSSNIHTVSTANDTSFVLAEGRNLKDNAPAEISVTSTAQRIVTKTLRIAFVGYGGQLDSARALDRDSDGLLDGLTLYFDRGVLLEDTLDGGMTAESRFNGTRIIHDVVSVSHARSDSSIVDVDLKEYAANLPDGVHQTASRPLLAIHGFTDIANVDSFVCEDFAGPAVWYASARQDTAGGEKKTAITVAFGERLMAPDSGTSWGRPEELFSFWTADSAAADRKRVDTLLVNAGEISGEGDRAVVFSVPRLLDTAMHYWIGIEQPEAFSDTAGNQSKALSDPVAIVRETEPAPENDVQDGEEQIIRPERTAGNCGDCGTGVELAFLPLLWLQASRAFRKRRRG